MHRIAGYGFDIGPFNNLETIRAGLVGQCEFKLAGPGALKETPDAFVADADIVVTGLSSFKTTDELALGRIAKAIGIPWIVVADVHRSWARPSALGHVAHAHILLASERERADASAFGYGNVHYIGGPPQWQSFRGLTPRRITETFTVYAGGFKSQSLTEEFLGSIADGVRLYQKNTATHVCMIFRMHPAEDGRPGDAVEAQRWSQKRTRTYRKIMRDIRVIEATSADAALCAADVSFFSSAGTETIKAAINRFPVGYYESDTIRARVQSVSGEPTWWPAEVGAAIKVSCATDVEAVLHSVQSAQWRSTLRGRQTEAYPEVVSAERIEDRFLRLCASL